MTISANPTAPKQANSRILSILLGILFLIPAVIACGLSQFSLSIGTFITSLQKTSLFGPSRFIGMANYSLLFGDEQFLQALKFTGLTVLVLLLTVAFVPALLAWGAALLGRKLRLALRVLFTIPAVVIIPAAIAVAWNHLLNPATGLISQPLMTGPAQARWVVLLLTGVYALGLACALALTLFLGFFRDLQPEANPWKPFLVVWGIGLIAAAAAGLQSFTLSYVLTGGGPASSTMNLLLYVYISAYMKMLFGAGAAAAIILLAVLAILGLAAGALAVFSNLKIEFQAVRPEAKVERNGKGRNLGLIALLVALLFGLLALILGILPLPVAAAAALKKADSGLLGQLPAIGPMLLNTFVPALIAVLFIQTPISYLAALGISGLRPLGKRSEWLLMPFCPWLFVGLAPFNLQIFSSLQKASLLGTFTSLLPRLLISVPMLVILALFFKGQVARLALEQGEQNTTFKLFFTRIILPSIPLALLLVFCGLLIGWFDLFGSLVFANKVDLYTLNNVLVMFQRSYSAASAPLIGAVLGLFIFPLMLIFFLVFSAYQLFYLDRLTIKA